MAKRKVKKSYRPRKDPLSVLVSIPMLGLYAVILLIIAIFMLQH